MSRDSSATQNPGQESAHERCLLTPDKVLFSIPHDAFTIRTHENPGFAIIGQDRAMLAIEMALNIRAKGYNIFVTGPAGTGKRTAINDVLSKVPKDLDCLRDICLVHDFKEEDSPRPLYLPAGKATHFRNDLRGFLISLADTLGDLSSQTQFRNMRDKLVLQAENEQQQLVLDFEGRVHAEGFKIVQVEDDDQQKADILPLIGDDISDFESLQHMVATGQMTESAYASLRERQLRFVDEMKVLFAKLQRRRQEIQVSLETLRMEILHPHIRDGLATLLAKYPFEGIASFLSDVQHHLESPLSFIHNATETRIAAAQGPESGEGAAPSQNSRNGAASAATNGILFAPLALAGQTVQTPQGSSVKLSPPASGLSPTGAAAGLPAAQNAAQSIPSSPGGPQTATVVNNNHQIETLELRSRPKPELPDFLRIYDVNILVDHSATSKNPVISEQYPDYAKLFGFIESPPESSSDSVPGHLLVKAGSLLKASGGYLVLRAEDLLRDEDVYVGVKRAMQEEALEIRPPSSQLNSSNQGIKPKPIKLNLKVIVMGGDGLYEALFERDEEFQKLFKVPAEFDSTVDRSNEICQAYADFFAMICREDKLLTLDESAVAALLKYAVRVAEFRNKVSTRFSLLADILRESHYWAGKRGASRIERSDVTKTLSAREFLYNLPEEKIDEQILQGEILMHVDGSSVGRINGLAVMDRGFYAFGRPTVISAQSAPGSDGVVNVEREAGLSGEIHDKGTFIVESYIQASYAKDFPLSINASICFEQSYSEVDGDSASSAEVYTLLSSVTGIALRQDIAVTGSVNQMGQIQPVGGVVEKIEGFYAVCRKVGLTGTQGVIIPKQNIINLMLSDEVEEAVRQGRFRIWAISTIDEGMEILTGIPAGIRNAKGNFPANSVNSAVERRLREMAKATKDFGN